jgi:hypothetical protein
MVFVDVPAALGTGTGENTNSVGTVSTSNAAGRDASGFMRVFVVAGGINLPSNLVNTTTNDSKPKAE